MYKTVAIFFLFCASKIFGQEAYIHTVNGKIKTADLGFSLTHEHIMSNFGAEPGLVSNYDTAKLFQQVFPYLRKVKLQGIHTIFDCTAAYFGRNVQLLKTISDSTGVNIVTNTGFYGASNDKYVPEFAKAATAEAIAAIWINEFDSGIDKTTIKPGFIKLAFDNGHPSDMDLKLFTAGVLTYKKTGLTLVVHTGNNIEAINEMMHILIEQNVQPNAVVWAHANKVESLEVLTNTALQGVWISLDGVKESSVDDYVKQLQFFKSNNLLHKILLSHDGNSFPGGGPVRQYDAIVAFLIPALKTNGFTDADIHQLMIQNPKKAFALQTKTTKKN
ncbi:MAG: phosphotriesterase [Bacteroidota bacterium]